MRNMLITGFLGLVVWMTGYAHGDYVLVAEDMGNGLVWKHKADEKLLKPAKWAELNKVGITIDVETCRKVLGWKGTVAECGHRSGNRGCKTTPTPRGAKAARCCQVYMKGYKGYEDGHAHLDHTGYMCGGNTKKIEMKTDILGDRWGEDGTGIKMRLISQGAYQGWAH